VIERIIDRLSSISPLATGLRGLSGPNLSRAGFGSRRATTRLAPYQSPKLGVVMIQPAPEQNRLTQMTDEELMADLSRRADALGVETSSGRKSGGNWHWCHITSQKNVMDEP
jgi:hypothetical protein